MILIFNDKNTNKAFKKLLESFKKFRNIIQQIKGLKSVFDAFFKLVLMFPGIVASIEIIILSICAAFTEYLQNTHIVLLSVVFILPGLIQLLTVPQLIYTIVNKIPFLKFKMIIYNGYYYTVAAYFLLLFVLLVLIIDSISKPVAPMKPVDFEEQINIENNDIYDPLGMDRYLEMSEYVIAKKLLNSDDGESFDKEVLFEL